jgi:hypothetical protein
MADRTYDNSGTLSKNDRKTEPKHADYTGSCTIEGKEFWMNAWIKDGQNGRKFMSFSFRPKEPKSQGGQSSKEQQRTYTVDDDTPF